MTFKFFKQHRPLKQTTIDSYYKQIAPRTTNNLKIWHININSLNTSHSALKERVELQTPKPDIIGVSETKNPKGRAIHHIPGYTAHHNDAESGSRGTAIYAREDLKSQEIQIRHKTKTKKDRFTAITMLDSTLIEAYAPVDCTKENEREEFYEDLNFIIEECRQAYPRNRIIVMGDMNAHVAGYYSEETNDNGRLLLRTCREQALAIAPFQGPTFERGDSKTAVDYILTDRQSYNDIT